MIPRYAVGADRELVESICSHPEVRKFTAGDGAPEFSAARWLQPPNMVVLVDHGCFLSNWLGDTTYGVHTNILPEGRGKKALEQGGLALLLAFVTSPAETFLTFVPEGNRRAEWFTHQMGFRYTYTQHGKWVKDGVEGWLKHYTLTVDEWILQGHLVGVGQSFHEEVEKKTRKANHKEDWVHDAYVGAVLAMALAGQIRKALKIYNRWALSAQYAPMQLVSTTPPVVDARDFFIRLIDGEIKIDLKEHQHA